MSRLLQSRVIHLISGTAKTGKDTLHCMLASGRLKFITCTWTKIDYTRIPLAIVWPMSIIWIFCYLLTMHVFELLCGLDNSNVYWYVLGVRNTSRRMYRTGLFATTNRHRYAFADALKIFCNDHMRSHTTDGQHHPDSWFEAHKDDRVIDKDGVIVTPRQIYIQMGTSQRQNDPDIWVRKCYDMIDHTFKSPDEHVVIDITDYRFRNECTYVKRQDLEYNVFTTRLYRGIAASDDPSEHDLDNEMPDFLMVGSMWHYAQCIWKHPEYARYNILGEMQMIDAPSDQTN